MSWLDSVPGCNARQFLQGLILNLVGFHADFCKAKNADYFKMLAGLCKDLLDLVEADTPPAPEVVANLISNLNTQVQGIIHKKEGIHNQKKFDDGIAEITRINTKLSGEFQIGIRALAPKKSETKSEKKAEVVVSTVTMRKALVDTIPRDKLLEQIELLRDVPFDKSCSTVVNRAFFKHSVATFGGLSALVGAGYAVLQSTLSAIFDGVAECQQELSFKDSRVLLPTALLTLSSMMLAYAYVKSKPPAPLAKTAVDPDPKDELSENLLPLNKSLSF